MAKAVRFPVKAEVWTPESFSVGFGLLAERNPLMSASDHMRAAFASYLLAHGISITQQLQHQEHHQ
jgi:hypothetical protein